MKKNLLVLFILLCIGCGRSTPTNYYILEGQNSILQTDKMPARSLRIAQVEVADYLSRNNIVSRVQGETRVILAEFHLWAEPVSNGVRRVLEETLTEPLLSNNCTLMPAATENRANFTLIINIQRLDGNFNEKAVLESRWVLMNEDERPIERGLYSAEELVNGDNYNVLVQAESKLVRGLGEHLGKILPLLITKH